MDKIILKMIEFQNQIKILHWQTNSYTRHKIYDKIYNKLGELIDDFVEVYQGKYPKLEFSDITFKIIGLDTIKLNDYIIKFINVLLTELPKQLDKTDTDLLNIRDEILSITHKLKYLCTLK